MSEQLIQEQTQPQAAAWIDVPETATQTPASSKKKKTVAELFHNYSNVKILQILRLVLGCLLAVLGALQLAHYGKQIMDVYPKMLDSIFSQDLATIFGSILSLVVFITMLVVVIVTVVSLIRKDHLVRFEIASTIVAVEAIGQFFLQQLPDASYMFVANHHLIAWAVMGITILFAFLRLFAADFSVRIAPLLFSLFAVAAIAAFLMLGCGDFLIIQIDNSTLHLSDLRLPAYMGMVSDLLKLETVVEGPEFLYLMSSAGYLPEDGAASVILIYLPQLLALAGSILLPVSAVSLFGYLIHVITGPNYLQHHNLRACQRVCISMLITAIFSAGAAALLMLLPEIAEVESGFATVQLDFQNVIITLVLLIALIVLTTVPWTMYRSSYRRHLAAYNASVRRGNV